MITRPLDLASRLRPEPRSFDGLFFVNAGLIVVFFSLFASKFVLAPSLGVDFRIPRVVGAAAGARPATHHLSVTNSGQIFAPDGLLKIDQLPKWLRDQAARQSDPILLVQADGGVDFGLIAEIASQAEAAGFQVRAAAEEPVSPGPPANKGRKP